MPKQKYQRFGESRELDEASLKEHLLPDQNANCEKNTEATPDDFSPRQSLDRSLLG